MKAMRNITILFFAILAVFNVSAQDIQTSLDAAQSAYSSDQALEARDNLQQSLIDLNTLIGKEILELMPEVLGGQNVDTSEDNILAGTGFAGLLVNRTYGDLDNKQIDITLANESSMLAMVNAFLSNSMLTSMMASQTGQKKVKISGYEGMLERGDGEDGSITYTINVPLSDSLFTMESTGFSNESEVLEMAQQLRLEKIVALLK